MPHAPSALNNVTDDGGGSVQKEDVICLTDTDSEDEVVCLTVPENVAAERPPVRIILKPWRRFNGMKQA